MVKQIGRRALDSRERRVVSSSFTGAESFTVLEDWENTNLTNKYSGSTDGWSIQSSTVFEGSNAGQCDGAYTQLQTSGNSTPSPGNTFEAFVRGSGSPNTAMDAGILFGFQDSDNWYRCEIRIDTTDLRLDKEDGGTTSNLIISEPSLSAGTWYRIEVQWHDNYDFTVTLYESSGTGDRSDDTQLAQGTASETEADSHGAGDYGWTGHTDGNTVEADLFRVVA